MFEFACEPYDNCNYDQHSFKAYLARWMAKSAILMPSIAESVTKLLTASATAAAQSCSGGDNKQTCGQKWYVGGYDGNYGVGQEMSALETVQSLLLLAEPLAPRHQDSVSIEVRPVTSTFSLPSPTRRTPSTTEASSVPGSGRPMAATPASSESASGATARAVRPPHLADISYRASTTLATTWTAMTAVLMAVFLFGLVR